MAAIATLTGKVAPGDLGVVAVREHLLYGMPGWHLDPRFEFDRAEAFERLLAQLETYKRLGGRSLVDLSGISLGRNVPLYRRLAEVSGVNIIAATGFDDEKSSIPTHFRLIGFFYRGEGPLQWKRAIPGHFAPSHIGSKEYLMFLFYNELTEGMASPSMIRSEHKAALVRTGTAREATTRVEELAVRGAAMAARKSGAPLYLGNAEPLERQLRWIAAERLAMDRVVIGHCDDARSIDAKRDLALAAQGAFVAYDHAGWEQGAPHAIPDERRAAMVKSLVDAGLAERVLLSCSAIGFALAHPGSRHGFTHLLESFVPRLQKAGVSEDAIETMLVRNPARLLAPAEAERP